MTKFNVTAYLNELRDQRDMISYELSVWNGTPMTYREMARIKVDADDFREEEALQASKTVADTFAEFEESYLAGALVAGSYVGAPEKQARYLAKLHWQEGERRLWDGRLLAHEARMMINSALAKLAPFAG
jgi:hypothetical protein